MMNLSWLWAALVDPSKMMSMALSLVDLAPSAGTQGSSFYPPLDSISFITNNSYGLYGGRYTAPADESSATSSRAYNYCTMPHPFPDSYQLPSPVQNHSVEAQLVYVEYVQRHQRRTAYNILPGGEDQPYNCGQVRQYLYTGYAANSPSQPDPAIMFAQAYTDTSNPFAMDYVNGSCQYPQLTLGGVLDGYQHGRDLWAVYGESLQLLPPSPDSDNTWFRSSNSPLTQSSAGAVLRGIWPDYRGPLPVHQQPANVDTINQGYPCPARSRLLSEIQSTQEWKDHLAGTKSLRERLGTLLGANQSDWMSTFDHFADNFQARLCNGYRLPCSVTDSSACVSENDAYEVFRAGDWEWNYWWRRNEHAKRYITLTEGLFLEEIAQRLELVSQSSLGRAYTHNFVHDGDLGPILGALAIRQLRWPGMASNVAFEAWKTTDSQYFVRVLYSGNTLETDHGSLDWIPLAEIVQTLRQYAPDDIVAMCNE